MGTLHLNKEKEEVEGKKNGVENGRGMREKKSGRGPGLKESEAAERVRKRVEKGEKVEQRKEKA